jgi:Fe-S oxidoreductase
VLPAPNLCCGRPLYDDGMLDAARILWRRTTDGMRPHLREGTKVVGVEPSCVAAFRDELPNLIDDDADAERLAQQVMTLPEFLLNEAEEWQPPQLHRKAIVHGHCHHEAVMGFETEQKLLEKLGLDVEVLDSGCCGMAGSFGFESEHYDISCAIGERRLLPAVREAPREAVIVADGFSCKTQIEQLTDRRALHTAQVLAMAREHGPEGPSGSFPERDYPDSEPAPPAYGKLAAAGVVAGAGVAAMAMRAARR